MNMLKFYLYILIKLNDMIFFSIMTSTCLMFMYDLCFNVNVKSIGYQHQTDEKYKKLYKVNLRTFVRVGIMMCRLGEGSAFFFRLYYYYILLSVIYNKCKKELYTAYNNDKIHRINVMLIRILCRLGEVPVLKRALIRYVMINATTSALCYSSLCSTLSIGYSQTSLSSYKILKYLTYTSKYGELFE